MNLRIYHRLYKKHIIINRLVLTFYFKSNDVFAMLNIIFINFLFPNSLSFWKKYIHNIVSEIDFIGGPIFKTSQLYSNYNYR